MIDNQVFQVAIGAILTVDAGDIVAVMSIANAAFCRQGWSKIAGYIVYSVLIAGPIASGLARIAVIVSSDNPLPSSVVYRGYKPGVFHTVIRAVQPYFIG